MQKLAPPPHLWQVLIVSFKNFLIKASMVHYWLGLFVSTETRCCFILWKGDRVVSPPICIPFPYEDNLPHLVDAVPFQIELIESQFGGLPTQEAFMALT